MCGILFMAAGVGVRSDQGLQYYEDATVPCPDDFAQGLMRRGPDCQGALQVQVGPAAFTFGGSLLQLRGAAPSSNPLVHDISGSLLLFKGEVFGGLEVPTGQNDGRVLLGALTSASSPGVAKVLSSLRGPWALVFWEAPTQTLWFGRDAVGRRSLLIHLPRPSDGRLMLTSSAPLSAEVPFEGFSELPPGLYSIQFGAAAAGAAAADPGQQGRLVGQYERHDWDDPWLLHLSRLKRAEGLVPPVGEEWDQWQRQQVEEKQQQLEQRGMASMGSSLSRGAKEAEGGSSSSSSSAAGGPPPLLSPALAPSSNRQGDSEGDSRLAQAVARVLEALRSAMEVRCQCIEGHAPATPCACVSLEEHGPPENHGSSASSMQPADSHPADLLAPSYHIAAPAPPAAAQLPGPAATHASTAPPPASLPPAPVLILFSGGLDSTLMAALAHEALPASVPIDLASVCFSGGSSPDRQAALDAFEELQSFAPTRHWRLIQVDRTLDDVDALRPHLLRLLAPLDTVMDLNIGAALWLATEARGRVRYSRSWGSGGGGGGSSSSIHGGSGSGISGSSSNRVDGATGRAGTDEPISSREEGVNYCSEARVVIMGHGADELCGGYGRHRTKFREGGWAGLNDELSLDLGRLWLRNLGRDDRLVADHGREARHPFLDEAVISAVLETPLELVADLRLPPGTGDKLILRQCLGQLGLPRAAARVKRAVHFGSGLSKQHNRRHFGSNSAANARSAGSLRLSELGLS